MLTNYEKVLVSVNNKTDIVSLDLPGRLKKLQESWSEFEIIQSRLEILALSDEDQLKGYADERNSFEDRYFSLSSRLQKLIKDNETISHTNSRENRPTNLSPSRNNEGLAIANNIKLPTINLPTFSGSYDTWLGFSDTFKSIVHDNKNIPDIQKLHYLKACLYDEAATVISSIETSSANYKVAWNLLKDCYDNRRVIVESHTKALLEMSSVSKDFSIRALLDHVQKHMRALRALEQPVDQWDTMLITLIKGKINYAIREKWED